MKKINPVIGIIWVSAILVISVVFYSLLETGNREKRFQACWNLILTGCNIGQNSAHVEGYIKNNCAERVDSVEVIPELYSMDGVLLFTGDPVYVENLEPADQGEFKAVIYAADSQAVACKAYVSGGY